MKLAVWSPRPDAPPVIELSESVCLYGLPVIAIVPRTLSVTEQALLSHTDSLIFVSANAVKTLLQHINSRQLLHKQIIAIGRQTAQALRQVGLSVHFVAPPPFTSEALLADNNFWQLPTQHIGLVCAAGGRTLLADSLRQNNKEISQIICYHRNPCPLSSKIMVKFIRTHKINAILISSCAIATAVAKTLRLAAISDYSDWVIFALSHRIEKHLKKLGFSQIIVSPVANQQALNETILTWWRNQHE